MRSFFSAVVLVLGLGFFASACGAEGSSNGVTTTDEAGAPAADNTPTPATDAGPVITKDASAAKDAGPSCTEQLTALGVAWTPTAARGVVDAVLIKDRINGVLFALEQGTTPASDPMACEFVLTLHKFAGYLKTKGVDHVGTLGSYCYRCCCAWSMTNFCRGLKDPEPSCGANGYSNHSWGRAIDIRYVYTTTGKVYDINDPKTFVMSANDTCTAGAAAQTGDSKFLYDLVCGAAQAQVFSTSLTPNFNSAHRNHFHLDIGQSGAPKGFSVQSEKRSGVDTADGWNNACGDE
jgi:hypothetical protein